MKIKNNAEFRRHIATVDKATLDSYFDQVTEKLRRARSPHVRIGCALALDDLACEAEMRRHPVSEETVAMTDEELRAALGA